MIEICPLCNGSGKILVPVSIPAPKVLRDYSRINPVKIETELDYCSACNGSGLIGEADK